MRRIALAFVLCALAAAAVATVPAAGGGTTPADIAQCLKGGWLDLFTDDGSHFSSQGACVSLLARGGTLGCPAPQVGPGPLAGGAPVGPGEFRVTGTSFATWTAYRYIELTLDGCGVVRFYNFETAGIAVPGGNLAQACPALGVFWQDETINLRCYLIAGRTVRAITIYDGSGMPVGYLATGGLAVQPMPTFSFGSTVESAPNQLTIPVPSGNAEQVTALQIHFAVNSPGHSPCGSGFEGWSPYFAPTDPNAYPNHPIRVIEWSGNSITLDFSSLLPSEFYPDGFTLCGIVMYWGNYVAVGTAFPIGTFRFYG